MTEKTEPVERKLYTRYVMAAFDQNRSGVYSMREDRNGFVSMYRVHFKWRGKDVVLCARSLDLTHPYFVSIKDLLFPSGSSVIINPSEDDLKRAFGEVNHLMIPFQTVALIEELPEAERARVMPFSLLERKAGAAVEGSKGPEGADASPAAGEEGAGDPDANDEDGDRDRGGGEEVRRW